MARPKSSDGILRTIENLWVREKLLAEKENRRPVKARVWRLLHGNEHQPPSDSSRKISKSATEKHIKTLEQQVSPKMLSLVEWRPWTDPDETAEESAFLLKLNTIKNADQRLNLFEHEARWGRRLRVALETLCPYGQYKIVCEYGDRAVMASHLGRELPYTEDMDGYLTYQPWLPQNRHAYLLAVLSEIVLEIDPYSYATPGMKREEILEIVEECEWTEQDLSEPHILDEIFLDWFTPEKEGPFITGRGLESDRGIYLQSVLDFWANLDKMKLSVSPTKEENDG